MLLVILTLICWLAGFAVLARMPACRDSRLPAPCDFSIVIPARNEAENLPILLGSIAGQSAQPRQIIVVDDDSSDRTAEIARQFGATVLPSGPLPQGWRGKTWACQQGVTASKAQHLLFLDADTRLEPDGLARIINAYHASPGTALSVSPYHIAPRPHEQFSAFFNLVMTAGIGAFTIWPRQSDGLFGQMLMVSKEHYERAGGHERVKGKILENLHLARHFRDSGTPLRCLMGQGALSIRMYPDGFSSLIEGWAKGFASGAGATAPPVLIILITWLSGAIMALSLFAQAPLWIALTVYVLFAAQIHWLLRRIGSFRLYTAIFYPIPLLFFFILFARSALRGQRSVTWKGRTIHAD